MCEAQFGRPQRRSRHNIAYVTNYYARNLMVRVPHDLRPPAREYRTILTACAKLSSDTRSLHFGSSPFQSKIIVGDNVVDLFT